MSVLLLAATLVLPGYVGCNARVRFALLAPTEAETAPTNTALWMIEHVWIPTDGRPVLMDDENRLIPTSERVTPLRDGLLLEVRPDGLLAPNRAHRIAIPGRPPVTFTTSGGADRVRPAAPTANVSAEPPLTDHCFVGGAVALDVSAAEALLFVATTEREGDVAIGREDRLTVPGEGEISVVGVDLAGNRSPPSAIVEVSAGGCRCTGLAGTGPGVLMILLLCASWVAATRDED